MFGDYWYSIKDGNDRGRYLYLRHYSARHYKDNRLRRLFVGPGEKLVLMTTDGMALFVWRKFRSMDNQSGVNCSIFRNEGPYLSSDLIKDACKIAWQKWPGERLYTYINKGKVKSPNPGYCFKLAGWEYINDNQNGKLAILEIKTGEIDQ